MCVIAVREAQICKDLCMLLKERDQFTALPKSFYVLGRESDVTLVKMDDCLFNLEDLLSSPYIT